MTTLVMAQTVGIRAKCSSMQQSEYCRSAPRTRRTPSRTGAHGTSGPGTHPRATCRLGALANVALKSVQNPRQPMVANSNTCLTSGYGRGTTRWKRRRGVPSPTERSCSVHPRGSGTGSDQRCASSCCVASSVPVASASSTARERMVAGWNRCSRSRTVGTASPRVASSTEKGEADPSRSATSSSSEFTSSATTGGRRPRPRAHGSRPRRLARRSRSTSGSDSTHTSRSASPLSTLRMASCMVSASPGGGCAG
mmetsp:Transcript_11728/g.37467  ORF Transcript_11728/g.37467 Transcript_11728/m.37467 type:complete len:253 (-) Transcript_11728:773-1531(-)